MERDPTLPADARAADPVGLAMRGLLQRWQAGEALGEWPAELDAEAAWTWLGLLSLGGTPFVLDLQAVRQPGADPQAGLAQLAHTVAQALEADAATVRSLASDLVQRLGLAAAPAALPDLWRAELLIAVGSLDDAVHAARAAFGHRHWALAWRAFERCEQAWQRDMPPALIGQAAVCLHRLGRYAEADRWVQRGLGEAAARLHTPPVFSEAQLLQRWGRFDTPQVSIVCTTYNHERYIDATMRGFFSQDCGFPFEVLVHDDASTDGTAARIRNWQAQYPRTVRAVLQTENQMSRGGRPFELLLAQARAPFVATCEGDDFWIAADKLSRQVGFLQQNPGFSCSAHNYLHFNEGALTLKPWRSGRADLVISSRQLMGLSRLLWLPTLVFRKTFDRMPPERALAPIGDQFLTSYLGVLGPCMYFETLLGAVRRENAFSTWSPLPEVEKERVRVRTWAALVRMHHRLGQRQAVADLWTKLAASPLAHEVTRDLPAPPLAALA